MNRLVGQRAVALQIRAKTLYLWHIGVEIPLGSPKGRWMSYAFAGTLLLPGEEGPGLDAVLETVDTDIKLVTGEEELGSWSQDECEVTPTDGGAFKVVLGGEMVLFVPDTPNQFADAMTEPAEDPVVSTPLKARIEAQTNGKPKKAAKPTKIEPLKSVGKEELLGRTVTMMVIAVSCVLIVALLVLTTTL